MVREITVGWTSLSTLKEKLATWVIPLFMFLSTRRDIPSKRNVFFSELFFHFLYQTMMLTIIGIFNHTLSGDYSALHSLSHVRYKNNATFNPGLLRVIQKAWQFYVEHILLFGDGGAITGIRTPFK